MYVNVCDFVELGTYFFRQISFKKLYLKLKAYHRKHFSFVALNKAESCSIGNRGVSKIFYLPFRRITVRCAELPVSLPFLSLRRDVLLPCWIYHKYQWQSYLHWWVKSRDYRYPVPSHKPLGECRFQEGELVQTGWMYRQIENLRSQQMYENFSSTMAARWPKQTREIS